MANITLFTLGPLVNSFGDVEKVLCEMANALTERGHSISIVCCDKNSGTPAFALNNKIPFFNTYTLRLPFALSKNMVKLRAFHLSREERKRRRSQFNEQIILYKNQKKTAWSKS